MKQEAPEKLFALQKWFGDTISQKMGDDIPKEATLHIQSTETLDASSRMQIYHQSYWVRLLDALSDEYPFVMRLFGREGFIQQIAIGYLMKHRPSHWSLHMLGADLVGYLEATYEANDWEHVLSAARLDWATQASFYAVSHPAIDLPKYRGKEAEKLLQIPLQLQSHAHLFTLSGHYLDFREAFLEKEPEYWQEHDFPKLAKGKTYYFIVYRNLNYVVKWDELAKEECWILEKLKAGMTIEEAIESVQKVPECDLNVIDEEIAFWVQKWLISGWLALVSGQTQAS